MWPLPRKKNTVEGENSVACEAIARAIIPGGDGVNSGGKQTIDAVKKILDSHVGTFGPPTFEFLARALQWTTLVSKGRPFSDLPRPEQEQILYDLSQKKLTRWPFLLLSGVVKTAHFDRPEHFESHGVSYDRSGAVERARWMQQVHTPDQIDDGQHIECDVVVVGTGAGGAVVGAKLASQGYAVAFVEEGQYHRRDEFDGRALPAHRKFFRHGTVALGNTVIPVQIGKMVGGSTAINAATCFRTPHWVLREWCRRLDTEELSPPAMTRHFDEVEAVLKVHTPKSFALGQASEIFGRGCEALGISHGPIRRNVSGCTGEGVCEFGCPADARQSTDISYVPRALRRGAVVFCGTRAQRVTIKNGRAAGIEAVTTEGHRIHVTARATILSCGAVPTPAFLLHQGICNSSGRVGRNLSLHPATGVAGLFDETVRGFDSVPQSYFSDQYLRSRGFLLAGSQLPLDVGGALLPVFGRDYLEVAQRLDQIVGSTVITHDIYRVGRVRAVAGGRPLITYRMPRRDVQKLHEGAIRLAQIYFAAGAEKVYPLVPRMPILEGPEDLEEFRRLDVEASDFVTTSWHPLGTCQMGTDPDSSVVGLDHECHDLAGLYIVDGSTLPGPTGVNPQITIMALANRAAERIMESI